MHKDMSLINKVLFGLLWGFSKFFGMFPMWLQYFFSDIIFFILRYLVRYRLKVVRDNLEKSFPHYSIKKIRYIERSYYFHLSDLFVETLLLASLTEKEMKKRMIFENKEVIDSLCDKFGMVIVASAHYASWEYTISYRNSNDANIYAVFHPLSNVAMDNYYFKARSRFGTIPMAMDKIAREMVVDKKRGQKAIIALIADQTPPGVSIKRWVNFLNRPTPFFNGVESLALRLKIPVVYLDVRKVKRGFYKANADVLFDGIESVEENVITKRYASKLEEIIVDEPQYWLWSHRRWKHSPKEGDKIV